ncbi:MAG: class I SAM-dependent rRNA methyltransferase [Bdellovibrionales bacterium]|nr:class I SAM-dependent rRNA methyltransferase [Bdellovibrionales bacterium]
MAQTMKNSPAKIWRLKRGSDRRVRAGHPWVYSNELQGSPKGIEPGEKVTLFDAGGKFLAHGYGNPSSLIAFRVVSRAETENQWDTVENLTKRLRTAWDLRTKLGANPAAGMNSFRWMFGEGDDFPGLVIDVYRTGETAEGAGTVVVVQAHTAGVDRIMPNLLQAVEEIAKPTGVVLRNDVSHRKQEGIPIEEPKVLGKVKTEGEWIRVRSADGHAPADRVVLFSVDLVRGQKTGFFLDQSENIGQFLDLFTRAERAGRKAPLRILDLCCYVGQWSTQIAAAAAARGIATEALLVDASARALSYAKANVEKAGGKAEVFEADVLADLPKLVDLEFDVVICDPPALIPSRKDIPTGKPAYLKLNTEAFRLLAPGGWMVTCSCSQLLEEEDFALQVSKGSLRNGREMRWLARGTQAIDHPMKLEFPEGKYLKMWIGKDLGKTG